jgi:hypothetical protein
VLGKKTEQQNRASQGFAVPFTGWCAYGYWQGDRLLNRQEYKASYYRLPEVKCEPVKSTAERIREERKSPYRESASRIAHRAIRRAQGLPEYHIPTLDEWRA